MGLLEGWIAGTQLGLQTQEAKLKADLWGSQAKHLDAQTQLLGLEQQKQQKFLELENLRGALTQPPAYEQEPGFIGPPSPPRPQAAMRLEGLHPALQDAQGRAFSYLNAGMIKEYGQTQQGILELQKTLTSQRTQQQQDQ